MKEEDRPPPTKNDEDCAPVAGTGPCDGRRPEDHAPQPGVFEELVEPLSQVDLRGVPHHHLEACPPRFLDGALEHQAAEGAVGRLLLPPGRAVIHLQVAEDFGLRQPQGDGGRGGLGERSFPADLEEQPVALERFRGQADGLPADAELLGQLDLGRQPAAGPAPFGNRLAEELFDLRDQAQRPDEPRQARSRLRRGSRTGLARPGHCPAPPPGAA